MQKVALRRNAECSSRTGNPEGSSKLSKAGRSSRAGNLEGSFWTGNPESTFRTGNTVGSSIGQGNQVVALRQGRQNWESRK